jgi:hypothetical protein
VGPHCVRSCSTPSPPTRVSTCLDWTCHWTCSCTLDTEQCFAYCARSISTNAGLQPVVNT